MLDYLLAAILILLILLAWILVQYSARRFAAKHPEFGPAKEEGVGCGKSCGCSKQTQCNKRNNETEKLF